MSTAHWELPASGAPARPLVVTGGVVHLGEDVLAAITPAVRLRAARLADVPAILELLDGFARRGLLLPRTPEQVYRNIREFVIAEDGDALVGCGALRIYSPQLAEIGALAVAEHCHGRGIGRCLVDALVDEALDLGIARVFALTLQPGFFHRLGFRTGRVEEFPQKIAADCASCAKRATCMEITVVRDLHVADA
ncbi:MAG: N-acetyltransferase [Gemmatimonadetes bacterium]|nr:N-acetyltransferase [Gemmatimonadota bacterium]